MPGLYSSAFRLWRFNLVNCNLIPTLENVPASVYCDDLFSPQ